MPDLSDTTSQLPEMTQATAGTANAADAGEASSFTIHCDFDPFENLEEAPGPEDCISYEEAQRLMAIAREHGDAALTPEQHNAIWDCLLAQPASQAWLQAQIKELREEATQRGLEPWPTPE